MLTRSVTGIQVCTLTARTLSVGKSFVQAHQVVPHSLQRSQAPQRRSTRQLSWKLTDGCCSTQTAVYASATVSPTGTVAQGTTRQCGKYYKPAVCSHEIRGMTLEKIADVSKAGDDCGVVSINYGISIPLFEQINPSLNSECTNLITDDLYCVSPTANWNATSSAAPVAAPAPTTPGATSQCYAWHTVVSGDYCALIENQYGISMDQLVMWNPDLKSDCSNLVLGDA